MLLLLGWLNALPDEDMLAMATATRKLEATFLGKLPVLQFNCADCVTCPFPNGPVISSL
jgi:hypothetical protein